MFCILLFLFLLGVSLCEVLELVAIFTTSQFHWKQNPYASSIMFSSLGGFTGFYFIDRSNLSSCGFYSIAVQ